MTVIPAYGRDYKSPKAAKADWDSGKDFLICDISCPDDGRYVNRQDLTKGYRFGIRYKRLTLITFHVNQGEAS
jgi:hypothetical protein